MHRSLLAYASHFSQHVASASSRFLPFFQSLTVFDQTRGNSSPKRLLSLLAPLAQWPDPRIASHSTRHKRSRSRPVRYLICTCKVSTRGEGVRVSCGSPKPHSCFSAITFPSVCKRQHIVGILDEKKEVTMYQITHVCMTTLLIFHPTLLICSLFFSYLVTCMIIYITLAKLYPTCTHKKTVVRLELSSMAQELFHFLYRTLYFPFPVPIHVHETE